MCAIRMRPTSGSAASTMQIGRRGMPILKLWRPQATKLASRTHKGNDDRKKNETFCFITEINLFMISRLFCSFIRLFNLFSFLHHPMETDLSGWLDNPGKLKTLIYQDQLLTKP